MFPSLRRFRPSVLLCAFAVALVVVAVPSAAGNGGGGGGGHAPARGKAVFFAADGMRQDLVEKYAAQGSCRRWRFLQQGA